MLTSLNAAAAGLAAAMTLSAAGLAKAGETCTSAPGGAGPARAAAATFLATLTPEQRTLVVRPFGKSDAVRWSNLPLRFVPRLGIRLGDLSASQTAAADRVVRAALSSCGANLLDGVRAADGVLKPLDKSAIGWDSANYFIAFIGEPSKDRPWSLKVDGHHLAYNITFNAPQVSGTPLFDGVEPVAFKVGGQDYEPLADQAGAMRALSAALVALPGVKLEGEFRDVTRGPTLQGDANFPITYPLGENGRGVAYATLTTAQKALVRSAMQQWVELPNAAISRPLMAEYLKSTALAQTWVGIAGSADLSTPGSYVRIDGPRVWIEFVVQAAVADKTMIHYHTLWRDKVADYGGAFAH